MTIVPQTKQQNHPKSAPPPLGKFYLYSTQAIDIEGRVYNHPLGKHRHIARCIGYSDDFVDLQYEPNGDLQS